MPRARRPLIALVLLIAVLIVGYSVRAARSDDAHGPSSSPGVSSTAPATP